MTRWIISEEVKEDPGQNFFLSKATKRRKKIKLVKRHFNLQTHFSTR
jgi:hypothetical protein